MSLVFWLVCSLLSFQMSQKRFRPAAMLFVFTVSAVVHEYILAICFGFFYPVLFCLFMCFGSKRKYFLTLWRFLCILIIHTYCLRIQQINYSVVCHKTKNINLCCLYLFFLIINVLCSLFYHSDVQLHSAWPKKRSHLEHNHVDIHLPGSGSHYLSVLPGVVCTALLSLERGNTCSIVLYSCPTKHDVFSLYGYSVTQFKVCCLWFVYHTCRYKFNLIWWYFCFSLHFWSYWSLDPGTAREDWWETDGLWPTFGLLLRTITDQC